MATMLLRNGDGIGRYIEVDGAGTVGDPFRALTGLKGASGNNLITDHDALSVSMSEHMSTYTKRTLGVNAIASGAIITPAAGKSLVIYGVSIKTDSTAGTIYLDLLDSANAGAGAIELDSLWPSKDSRDSNQGMHKIGVVDDPLMLVASNLSNNSNVHITVNYAEH